MPCPLYYHNVLAHFSPNIPTVPISSVGPAVSSEERKSKSWLYNQVRPMPPSGGLVKPPYTIHRLRVVLRDILNEFEHIHGKKEKKICFSTSFSRLSYDGIQPGGGRRWVGRCGGSVATATTTIWAPLLWKWIGKFKACPIIESSWGNFWPCAVAAGGGGRGGDGGGTQWFQIAKTRRE